MMLYLSLLLTPLASAVVLNNNGFSVNNVGGNLRTATLDKIKLIRHIPSGKCLIVDNHDAKVGKLGDKIVLWECHDLKHIAGLEQEMFSLLKSPSTGYMLLGRAGSLDHCPFAGRQYYDTLEVSRCDPTNALMSWSFRRVIGTIDSYQIVQGVTNRCLRVPDSPHDGAWVRVGDCDIHDKHQTWRVCGLDNDCSFSF